MDVQAGLRSLTVSPEGFAQLFGAPPGNAEAEQRAGDTVTKSEQQLAARAQQEIQFLPFRS